MFLRFRFVLLAIVLPCVFFACNKDEEAPYDVQIDFQSAVIPLDPGYINNAGGGMEGAFTEGAINGCQVSFPNYYNAEWGSWSGFAYSMVHDMETDDFSNFGVYVANDPPTNKFLLVYASDPVDFSPNVTVSFSKPVKDLSFDVANATYGALSMKNGDGFAKKFTATDWFTLTITAIDAEKKSRPPKSFKLADGTKIVDKWTRIEIAGEGIVELQLSLSSTDNGAFGMNTPAYFCIDNIKARTVK